MTSLYRRWVGFLLLGWGMALQAAESLAPPHAPLVEGLPVAVTAHPEPLSLLESGVTALAANKRLVYDYWRQVWLGGDAAGVNRFLAPDYIEHNPLLPTGRTAFRDWLAANRPRAAAPEQIPDLVTLVAEGPWVVMALVTHYPEPDGSGATYTSTHFEMFRIEDGRIAEHWDSTLFRAGQQVPEFGAAAAVPVEGLEGLAQHALLSSDDATLFRNKRLVFDLWRHIPEGGREELAELYMDPIYIQHNPNAATGRDGAKAYFSRRPDSAIETYLEDPLVAMVAEGDLVVQVLETERVQNGVEYKVPWFDMFRIEGHRVIEHWDTASKGELPADMLQGHAQQSGDFSATTLLQAPASNWPTNGGNLYNQRYSPLAKVNRDNVQELKGVWHTRLRGSGAGPQYSGEAQPLVQDGVAYVVTGADDVFAIDVESGAILWQYVADLPAAMSTVCCGWTSRGVGMSEEHVYVGQLDGQLKALDRNTGEVVWAVQAERWQEGYTITAAPLYYDGMVIIGFAGSEVGIRGRLKAFDAQDGSLLWTFYTIPAPGEFGSETWSDGNMLWQYGGASIWSTPAVDPELGMLYFATGNAAANSNGSHRPGDNLFTASILALDAATGEYRWHFQQVHHDIWDYDAPNPVMLFDIEIDGELRKGLAQAGKTGWFYILDRITGEPLIGIEERPVPQEPRQATSATQPFPIGDAFVPQSIRIAPEGVELVNEGRIFTPYWTDTIAVAPGAGGGANWPPSAYDPTTGHAFVCAADRPFLFAGVEISDAPPEPGGRYTAGVFLGPAMYNFGVLAAVDMHTNRLVWQQHLEDFCFSGMTATGGGLVFVGRNDGRLTALDSSTGHKLWEFQTGAGMNAPVTVFEHEGKQYVLAYAAGNVLAGSKHGDSLWLFGLDGTLPPVEETPAPAAQISFSVAEGAADLAAGKQSYDTACFACHGVDGKSGHGGADLTATVLDAAGIAGIIATGKGTMPPFADIFTPEQLRDVAGYVAARIRQP